MIIITRSHTIKSKNAIFTVSNNALKAGNLIVNSFKPRIQINIVLILIIIEKVDVVELRSI